MVRALAGDSTITSFFLVPVVMQAPYPFLAYFPRSM